MIWLRAVSFSSSRTGRRSPRAPPSIFRCPRKYATTKPSRCAVRWTPDPGKPNFGAWRVKSAGPNSRHWLRRRWRMDEASPQKPGTAERPGRCEGARLSGLRGLRRAFVLGAPSRPVFIPFCLRRHRCRNVPVQGSRSRVIPLPHHSRREGEFQGQALRRHFPGLIRKRHFPPLLRADGADDRAESAARAKSRKISEHIPRTTWKKTPPAGRNNNVRGHILAAGGLSPVSPVAPKAKRRLGPPARHANNGGSPLFRQSITFAGGLPQKPGRRSPTSRALPNGRRVRHG